MITPPHFGLKKQEKHNETDYKKEEKRRDSSLLPAQ